MFWQGVLPCKFVNFKMQNEECHYYALDTNMWWGRKVIFFDKNNPYMDYYLRIVKQIMYLMHFPSAFDATHCEQLLFFSYLQL
jgi:hypothetical protein